MEDGTSAHLLLIAGLLLLQAILTLAYGAVMNLRPTTLREQAESGNVRAQQAIYLLNAATKLDLSYVLCRTLIYFAVAALATAQILTPLLLNDAALTRVPMYLIVLLLGMLSVVVGEVVPEGVGNARSEALFPYAVRLLGWMVFLLTPLTVLLLAVSRVLAGMFGSSSAVDNVTEEEIMTLVNAGHTGGAIEEKEKDMIYSVLQLDQTWARELMTPRMDIVALAEDTPLQEALDNIISSGFSRIPIYEDNIDNIIGLLYAKDLLALWRNGQPPTHISIRDMVRPAYFIPETKRADELLRELQNRNVHMAIVVDEYGGTAGLVTIENLIEEIVGDIRDEFDQNEEVEYIQKSDDEYIVDASMDIDDFNQLLETHLSNDDHDTLAGFIYTQLGRVPMVDDVIKTEDLTLRVRSLDGRRIRKVEVKRHPKTNPQETHLVTPEEETPDTSAATSHPTAEEKDDDPLANAS